MKDKQSEVNFSRRNSFLNILAEFLESNGLCIVASDCVNYFLKLLFGESVLELIIDISELINREFSFTLEIVQTKVGSFSLFIKRVSLK